MKSDKSYRELCERVVHLFRDERKRQGLSKYEMEQRCGVSQQMIGYVERGMRNPSLETAVRMADGLGFDLEKIIAEARKNSVRKTRSEK